MAHTPKIVRKLAKKEDMLNRKFRIEALTTRKFRPYAKGIAKMIHRKLELNPAAKKQNRDACAKFLGERK